jgi:hypothetical protein
MSEPSDAGAGGGADSVDFDMTIANGRTEIRVSGDRDTAVIVRSAGGEQIYLPPEDFDRPPESGRSTPYESPYESASGVGDTPYRSSGSRPVTGQEPTADGYRIVHPEPVTDVRFLR